MFHSRCRFCVSHLQRGFDKGCAVHYINKDRLEGPPVGSLVLHAESKYDFTSRRIMRVVEQSYVWAPGDPFYGGGVRNYGECVVEYEPKANGEFKRLVVRNKDLTELKIGDFIK